MINGTSPCAKPDSGQSRYIVEGLGRQFGGEACQTYRDPSAESPAVIRRMTLNVLSHDGPGA